MSHVLDWVLGRPLATREEKREAVGVTTGIPVLGLDALASSAYGPEAALTILIAIGAAGSAWLTPIVAVICLILVIVAISYRQTIAAYPQGGGSFTVARENLGHGIGLLAGAALALDYVLNVAVGISAGVGAVASAIPALLPHTLAVCLAILVAITLVNLRGIKQAGIAFAVPTFVFVVMLGLVIAIGIVRSIAAGGSPQPVVPPPRPHAAVEVATAWLLLRAFASGTTAMTGVEAVSNAVPIFRAPTVARARRTLTAIVAILVALLLGIAYLCHAYGVVATRPGEHGYQSVLSMLAGAVLGRGALYYVTLGAVLAVLTLSANTSFADFPRVCRLLAEHHYLPRAFAERGRRLVFSAGIVTLAVLAAGLLVAFGGITDRLIPLFAIGALLAFTLSQAGMVVHWRRSGGPHARRSRAINATGAVATGTTLVVVAVSKFAEGAWLVLVLLPLVVLAFARIRRHARRLDAAIATSEPLELPERRAPIVLVLAGTWTKVTQHALRFALRLSDDLHVVHIETEDADHARLAEEFDRVIARPAQRARIAPPKLVVLRSQFRQFYQPFIEFIHTLERDHPDRDIAIVVPELETHHWYGSLFHENRGKILRELLAAECSNRVVVITTPFHVDG